jgi:hypothetical protein
VPDDDFECVVGLIGATASTLFTFVFPPGFYLLLRYRMAREAMDTPLAAPMPLVQQAALVAVIMFGIATGVNATISAVKQCPF